MNAKELQDYRIKLFTDVYNNVVPDRVPIIDAISFGCHVEYAGEDFLQVQYHMTPELLTKIFENTLTFAKGDQIGLGAQKNAISLMLSKSNVLKIASNGMIQHPEVCTMYEDEYDEFIADPYAFMVEKIRPRMYGMADTTNPVEYLMNYMKNSYSEASMGQIFGAVTSKTVDKYGLFKAPAGVSGSLPVPFDVLSDMNRGFSNIVKDIKRQPEKVLDAIEALVPYSMWTANRSIAHPLGANGIPTHMAPFIRLKEFEKFYFPTFKKLIHMQAARGQATNIFCESDWERYADYLAELPMGTRMYMEKGNPQVFKDKMGKKIALGGFYPIDLIKSGTKEQCLDKVKEIMDIMMPGGNYFFRFDKSALRKSDLNLENYNAVMDYVLENGHYSNAGELVSDVKKEDTIVDYGACPEFKSKYFVSFEEWAKDYVVPDESVREVLKQEYDKYSARAYTLLLG